MNPEQIIVGGGTAGLILFLSYALRELWGEHKRHDMDAKAERDEAIELVKGLVQPVETIAKTQETQNRILERLATRRRDYDGAGDRPTPDKR